MGSFQTPLLPNPALVSLNNIPIQQQVSSYREKKEGIRSKGKSEARATQSNTRYRIIMLGISAPDKTLQSNFIAMR
eukprot:466100-Amphidinium_carterae.1